LDHRLISTYGSIHNGSHSTRRHNDTFFSKVDLFCFNCLQILNRVILKETRHSYTNFTRGVRAPRNADVLRSGGIAPSPSSVALQPYSSTSLSNVFLLRPRAFRSASVSSTQVQLHAFLTLALDVSSGKCCKCAHDLQLRAQL
jgi:hypothetical protein